MERKNLFAVIVAVVGLIGMFFFPSPEENFLYYVGFVVIVMTSIIFILKKK